MRFNFSYYLLIFKILKRNKLRSFLTSLGIIIGIASIIIIMSVGAGAHSLIVNEINTVGSNLIGVLPGATDDSGIPAAVMGVSVTTLTVDDGLAIEEQVAQIEVVAAYFKSVATISLQNKNTQMVFGNHISQYPIDRSVEDGTTVPIYYEGRLVPLHLMNNYIDEDFDKLVEEHPFETKEFLKKKWARIEEAIGGDDRLQEIAEDIVFL